MVDGAPSRYNHLYDTAALEYTTIAAVLTSLRSSEVIPQPLTSNHTQPPSLDISSISSPDTALSSYLLLIWKTRRVQWGIHTTRERYQASLLRMYISLVLSNAKFETDNPQISLPLATLVTLLILSTQFVQ